MEPYGQRYAERYDLFYANKPYTAESEFVQRAFAECAVAPGQRVLELACGTGSHALELARRGYQVVATDRSAAMLEHARRKAAVVDVAIEWRQQDFCSLALPDLAPFDAAYCLFDSIGYALTNQALDRLFASVARHLRDGAPFVFEFWHAAAMLRGYTPLRLVELDVPGAKIARVSRTALDLQRQCAVVTYEVHEHRADRCVETYREEHANRFFLVQEMAHFLTTAGFAPVAFCAGFDRSTPVDENTWHVVTIARKQPPAIDRAAAAVAQDRP